MDKQKQREFAQGPWRLVLTYRHPGSRSEGTHGELFRNGKSVEGQEPDQTLVTDLGTMQYFGKEGGQLAPWMPTGWHFADPQKRIDAR